MPEKKTEDGELELIFGVKGTNETFVLRKIQCLSCNASVLKVTSNGRERKVGEIIATPFRYKTRITYLFVEPPYRERGIGTSLVSYMRSIANSDISVKASYNFFKDTLGFMSERSDEGLLYELNRTAPLGNFCIRPRL